MEQITAGENITIEVNENQWRIINNGAEQILVQAEIGKPLSYINEFAATRRLPKDGMLPVEYIQRVVLGWSNTDESWHLGLLLASDLAQARGSRWCEMASWPDPTATAYNEVATRAGKALAQVTTRPFYVVPPERAKPQTPERPLPDLPLAFDSLWTFERMENGSFHLLRSGRWTRTTLRRILWYSFWTVVFILLIILNVTSGIAPPNPPFLPLLGAFAAVVLVGLVVRNIYRLAREPNRYVVDIHQRQIRAEHGRNTRWQLRPEQIQSIYVSQVVNRGRRKAGKKNAVVYGEINLLLTSGKFRYIFATEDVEIVHDMPQEADSVSELSRQDLSTDLQAVGMYIAQSLDLPIFYDHHIQ